MNLAFNSKNKFQFWPTHHNKLNKYIKKQQLSAFKPCLVPKARSKSRLGKPKQNLKFLRLQATIPYIYPIVNIVFYGRNTYSSYPISLFLYQFMAFPTFVFFKNTLLILTFYMLLLYGIVFNKNVNKTVRFHGAIANMLDLTLLCLMGYKALVSPYIRWSYMLPLIDSFLFTFYLGLVLYGFYYACKVQIPTLPRLIQKRIDEFLQ